MAKPPQKKYYRQRAHSNPMADHSFEYPVTPEQLNITTLFPNFSKTKSEQTEIEFADIGCGYGGLLVALSPLYPDTLMIGMEIRVKVSDYVTDRISTLRNLSNHSAYNNIACIRTNAMKYLPNFFKKSQLSKIFFLFPDPHFKKSKHKWRIINRTLLAEYAFILKEKGLVYTMTDVKDLHFWMKYHFNNHPLFEPVSQSELDNDPVVEKIYNSTEEGQKVTRNNGEKFLAVFRRISDPFEEKSLS